VRARAPPRARLSARARAAQVEEGECVSVAEAVVLRHVPHSPLARLAPAARGPR